MDKTDLYIYRDGYRITNGINGVSESYDDYLLKKVLIDLVDELVADELIHINDVDSFWEGLSEYRFELYEKGIDSSIHNEELINAISRVSKLIESDDDDKNGNNAIDKQIRDGLSERIIKILDTRIIPVMMSRVSNKEIQLNVDDGLGIIKTQITKLLREYGFDIKVSGISKNENLNKIQVFYDDNLIIDVKDGQGVHKATCKIENDRESYVLFKVITDEVEDVKVFFPFFCYGDAIEVKVVKENGSYLFGVQHDITGISVTKQIGRNNK